MQIRHFFENLSPYLRSEQISNLRDELANDPIQFVEIGGAGGGERFAELGSCTHFHSFEPDPTAARILTKKMNDDRTYQKSMIHAHALMGKPGEVSVNITKKRTCSSVLKPNFQAISRFTARRRDMAYWPDYFNIVDQVQCRAETLASFFERESLSRADFIQIDTQGSELEILASGERFVEASFMLHVEMEVWELYQNQPIMHDILKFMYNLGFRLLAIENQQNISRAPATGSTRIDRGELLSVDGYFIKNFSEDFLDTANTNPGSLLKYISMLDCLGFKSTAIDLGRLYVQKNPEQEMVHFLVEALERKFIVDDLRAQPLLNRLSKMVPDAWKELVPASLRRKLKLQLRLA